MRAESLGVQPAVRVVDRRFTCRGTVAERPRHSSFPTRDAECTAPSVVGRNASGPGFQELGNGDPVFVQDVHGGSRGEVRLDPQGVQQGQARTDLVTASRPLGDVGQQECAAPHRKSHTTGDAAQSEHQIDSTSPRTSTPRS